MSVTSLSRYMSTPPITHPSPTLTSLTPPHVPLPHRVPLFIDRGVLWDGHIPRQHGQRIQYSICIVVSLYCSYCSTPSTATAAVTSLTLPNIHTTLCPVHYIHPALCCGAGRFGIGFYTVVRCSTKLYPMTPGTIWTSWQLHWMACASARGGGVSKAEGSGLLATLFHNVTPMWPISCKSVIRYLDAEAVQGSVSV